jgi:hypothetical protein
MGEIFGANDATAQGTMFAGDFKMHPAALKDVVTTYVVVQNKNIGHSLIPEVRDLYEAWVEFTVKDASGNEICHSGFLKPDGMLDPRAPSFTKRPVNGKASLSTANSICLPPHPRQSGARRDCKPIAAKAEPDRPDCRRTPWPPQEIAACSRHRNAERDAFSRRQALSVQHPAETFCRGWLA